VLLDDEAADFEERRKQKRRVKEFFERFRNPDGSFNAGAATYENPEDFKRKLEKDLRALVDRRLRAVQQASETEPGTSKPSLSVASSSPTNNLPSFNPDFVGREEPLKELHRLLTSGQGPAVTTQAITGLGGIGKTQTALAYCYRHLTDYRLIWWLHAESPATLAADYVMLAEPLGLDPAIADQEKLTAAIRTALQARDLWLLVFNKEIIPLEITRFIAEQLDLWADHLAGYASRFQTHYKHSSALQEACGYRPFEGRARSEIQPWLLQAALGTSSGINLAARLLEELRHRQIIVPGPTVIERLVTTALLGAERHVARELTHGLTTGQIERLDGLLEARPGSHLSHLAWARQPPGAAGHCALARLLEPREALRAIALDPRRGERAHPERLRELAQEGSRLTAQHLRALTPLRRRAVLVATVLETATRLPWRHLGGRLWCRRSHTRRRAGPADDSIVSAGWRSCRAPVGLGGHAHPPLARHPCFSD
jgi:hypothetical protein